MVSQLICLSGSIPSRGSSVPSRGRSIFFYQLLGQPSLIKKESDHFSENCLGRKLNKEGNMPPGLIFNNLQCVKVLHTTLCISYDTTFLPTLVKQG